MFILGLPELPSNIETFRGYEEKGRHRPLGSESYNKGVKVTSYNGLQLNNEMICLLFRFYLIK